MEWIGWAGAVCFALCGVPQAWKCYQTKSAQDISWAFLMLWLFGELLTIAYVWPSRQYPLLFNYGFNLMSVFVILYYKWQSERAATSF